MTCAQRARPSNSRDLQHLSTLTGERDETTDSVTAEVYGAHSSQRSIRRVPILAPDALRTLPLDTGVAHAPQRPTDRYRPAPLAQAPQRRPATSRPRRGGSRATRRVVTQGQEVSTPGPEFGRRDRTAVGSVELPFARDAGPPLEAECADVPRAGEITHHLSQPSSGAASEQRRIAEVRRDGRTRPTGAADAMPFGTLEADTHPKPKGSPE